MSRTLAESDPIVIPPPGGESHYAYFLKRHPRARFVSQKRFPSPIDFNGMDVLDIGCGYGSLSICAAEAGAKKVVGVDPEQESIDIAEDIISKHFPTLRKSIELRQGEVKDLPKEYQFDVAASFAVFEHVPDPAACLRDVAEHMRPGAKVYLGIGPLWRSAFGDHGRTLVPFGNLFPWAHLLFSEKWLVNHRNRLKPDEKIESLEQLGMNLHPIEVYLEAFEWSGMEIEHLSFNQHEKPLVKFALNTFAAIPGLREFFTQNIYCVLRKPQ